MVIANYLIDDDCKSIQHIMFKKRYLPLSIFLHWLVFLLALAALSVIELKGQFVKESESRELCKTIHSLLGQLIFAALGVAAWCSDDLWRPRALWNKFFNELFSHSHKLAPQSRRCSKNSMNGWVMWLCGTIKS